MKLAEKIRILRRARGLTQQELGDKLSRVREEGISRQSISDWENGNTEPKLENIRDLAEVLNVSFDALLDENINLENNETLARVLLNLNKKTNEQVDSSFSYDIYYTDIRKRDYLTFVATGFLTIMSIILIILGIFLTKQWYFGLSITLPLLYGLLLIDIRKLKRMIQGSYRNRFFGTLYETYLTIYVKGDYARNTIYIPIEKVEKIELGENQKRTYGDIIISIKDKSRTLDLKNVTFPKKLIELFNSLNGFIENEDEFKIL
ncbi:MAG TPA: helix-turn-helix transcriptional regulator [Acholeplasmataceae bacterium]|nr:helix-turn-helix transcriptional regulator [Acholeplasmataceae bacterium]HQC30687.1 helix-turn-helix transcriptional regulator [Acholeplasmataceae bacterium]